MKAFDAPGSVRDEVPVSPGGETPERAPGERTRNRLPPREPLRRERDRVADPEREDVLVDVRSSAPSSNRTKIP